MAAIARISVRNVMGTPNGFCAEYRNFIVIGKKIIFYGIFAKVP